MKYILCLIPLLFIACATSKLTEMDIFKSGAIQGAIAYMNIALEVQESIDKGKEKVYTSNELKEEVINRAIKSITVNNNTNK